MAQLRLSPYGSAQFDVAVSTQLAVYTNGSPAKVYQTNGPGLSNPQTMVLLGTVDAEQRVFSFSAAKTVCIEAGGSEVLYEAATIASAEYWTPPNPFDVHQYFNDFDAYTAGNWTITETGSGSRALADGVGGLLLITNAAADDDANFFQKTGESFKFQSGKRLWFEMRFQVNDATESDIVAGLQITDTSPLAVTDGVYFLKADGAATADFVVMKNSTATTASAVATLADATNIVLGFYYDGSTAVKYYVNRVYTGSSVLTNLPDDEELTISFGIQNGAAAAKTMTVDYILAAQER
jgi:hypothetical protein